MTDKKTSLTKKEKEKIKDKRPTRTMTAEEWAEVQGMYQLFAYGKKYNLNTVVLVYPKWSRFNESMKFEFDKELSLLVIPFALTRAGLSDCAPIIDELHLGLMARFTNGSELLSCTLP